MFKSQRSRAAATFLGKTVAHGLVFGAIWALLMAMTLTVWLITAARLVRVTRS